MNAFTPIDKGEHSYLDWKVVEMARQDGARSANPDGIVASILRTLGFPVASCLANEKLEALRRFSVRAWHWDLIRNKDIRNFLAAGYTRNHVLEILSRVSMARGFMPTIEDDSEHTRSRVRSSNCRCG